MPDWTYHPAYRPLIFRMPAEDGRRMTVALLGFQGRTAIGRRLFSLLSYGIPPPAEGLEVFGLRFASPFGLGPGLDTDGRAFSVLQYLGCGFLTAGPTTMGGRPRVRALDRQRVPEHLAMAWSTNGHVPSLGAVDASLTRQARHLRVPVGVVVEGDDPAAMISGLDDRADFFSIGPGGSLASEVLASAGAATARPILLRLALDAEDDVLLGRVALAVERGFDGVVVGDSEAYAGLPGGRMLGQPSATRTLAAVAAVVGRFGPSLPVVAGGGVLTPIDAMAALDAGARLVEVTAGWIYSGPGVVARTLDLRRRRPPAPPGSPLSAEPEDEARAAREPRRTAPVALEVPPVADALGVPEPDDAPVTDTKPEPDPVDAPVTDTLPAAPTPDPPARSGALAATTWALAALGGGVALAASPVRHLRRVTDGVPFLLAESATDASRSAGCALTALGVLALATRAHLRRGAWWPSWSLVAVAALAMPVSPLLGVAGLGLALVADLTSGWLRRGFRQLFERGSPAWRWSAATLGRRCVQATGIIAAVLALAADGPGEVRVAVGGLAIWGAWLVQRGLRPGLRPMWWALIPWLATVGAAAGFLVDSRGQAVWLGLAAAFALAGLAWLYRPLIELDESASAFPDI